MKYLLLIIAGLVQLNAWAGPKKAIVAFYNCENLFDTIDDPHINDNEYLPTAKKQWDSKKYAVKLNNLSRVISSIDANNLPFVVGLCEVENREVMADLFNAGKLKGAGYEIVHRNSPDARGIDVGAAYRKDKFNLLEYHYYPVYFEGDDSVAKTREILHLKGILFGKDTVHIFFNHWPSRFGGEEKTIPKRKAAAEKLKEKTDSIFTVNSKANIVIMGDLNDHPSDPSVQEVLGAKKEGADKNTRLINLLYEEDEEKTGSHYWNKEWRVLDNIIVSNQLLVAKKKARTVNANAKVYKPEWVLFTKKSGEVIPSRSYSGAVFHENGFSDHMAIYLTITSR